MIQNRQVFWLGSHLTEHKSNFYYFCPPLFHLLLVSKCILVKWVEVETAQLEEKLEIIKTEFGIEPHAPPLVHFGVIRVEREFEPC